MEVNLTDIELNDIIASGALASTSWSEIVLKLSIAGIELTYDVFLLFLASFLLYTKNNLHKLILDELNASDSLDNFFKDVTTSCLIYNMKRIQKSTFEVHSRAKIVYAYRAASVQTYVSKEECTTRAAALISVIAKKFPETIWVFYCKNKQTLWKEDYKFCTSLLHYFSQLAQANDSRCNFDAMLNKMSNEQYEMLNTNAFMN